MAKTVKQQIKEGKDAIKEIMQENLANISQAMIDQIISRLRRLTPSQYLTAIKDVDTPGVQQYKSLLQTAFATIAGDAIDKARKEVPKAKNIKLADEWTLEELPTEIQRKIKADSDLLVGTQVADLEKNIFFQFTSSHDSTDSIETVRQDLEDSADDYVRGPGVESGAGISSAKYVNEARQSFFYDDDVLEQIDAFQFVNGDPVSEICQELAGTIFAKDDPDADRYQPPLHWNCKSYIVPILAGDLSSTADIERLQPSKKAQDSIQFSEKADLNCPCCHPHVKPQV